MAFNNITDFISMGTHGTYVWSAWFLACTIIILIIYFSIRQRKKIQKKVLLRIGKNNLS